MPFLNIPLKSIQANVVSVSGIQTMPWYDPQMFPVIPGDPSPDAIQIDFRWSVELEIETQQHSSYITRAPGIYNGQDISVGMWISNSTTGQAWQIISIQSKTINSITATVQDIFRYNTYRDQAQVGNGAPITGTYIIFGLGENGFPVIDPVPPAGISATFSQNLQSRFEYINLQYDYPLYQPGNTFAMNDVIAVNPVDHTFVLADSQYRTSIGRITSLSDTLPGWFTINPVQKVVDNLDYLPGGVGDIIYTSLVDPGQLTTDVGGSQIYIKLRNNTSSISFSTALGPTTPGNVFQLNGVDVEVPAPGDMYALVSATNLLFAQTGVGASVELVPTTAETNPSLINSTYGEPALWSASSPATAVINGIPVIFNISSTDVGYTDYARPTQMAQSINDAEIPNIIATVPSPQILKITNTAGGAITIINGTADINGVSFAGTNSGSGIIASTPASVIDHIKFVAVDARSINFLDVVGTTVSDFGLISVENGVKACGLYIEEGLRTSNTTVVTDLAQLNMLDPLIGDQAYVINSADAEGNNVGEWSLWLFDGVVWIKTATQDSASTDARSLEYTITVASPSNIDIGTISTGRRITLITVEVLEPFDGITSLDIGYQINNVVPPPPEIDGLMINSLIDLSQAGTYTTSTDILFGTDTEQGDVLITARFINGTSINGNAQIIVSYV